MSATSALAMLCILLVSASCPQLVRAQWPNDESQQCDAQKQTGSECASHILVPPPACICSDVQVQPSSPNGTVYTCADEYNIGNCGQSFLKQTIVAIPEGYCQVTCGQCGCSKTITQVLQQLQANTFLQAAQTTGLKAQFDLPGFTATVLAPSDAAFTTYLNGAQLSSINNDDLLALLELHVLPPVPKLLTPWTTPFFVSNPTLTTWLGGANSLTTARATAAGANFTVSSGAGPAANIVTADVEAGRGFVDILDRVLSPAANSMPVPLPAAGSGPNGGVGIETFNMTSMPAQMSSAVSTAG